MENNDYIVLVRKKGTGKALTLYGVADDEVGVSSLVNDACIPIFTEIVVAKVSKMIKLNGRFDFRRSVH